MGDIDEKLLKFRQTTSYRVTTNEKTSQKFVWPTSRLTKIQNWIIDKFKFRKMNNSPKQNVSILIKDGQKEEEEEDDEEDEPEDEETLKRYIFKLFLKFALWSTLFALFIRFEFGLVYFVVSLLVIIYLNTSNRRKGSRMRRRKGELSAYSVFNKNVERIQGTITAEQLQNNLMGGGLF
jgi:hypothetical protein